MLASFSLMVLNGLEPSYKIKFESFDNDLIFGNQNAVPMIRSASESFVGASLTNVRLLKSEQACDMRERPGLLVCDPTTTS